MIQFNWNKSGKQIILPVTRTDRILEGAALLLCVLMWVFATLFYLHAPDTIPIHFNASGRADGFGFKSFYFFIAGFGTAAMIICAIAAYKPRMINIPIRLNPKCLFAQYILMVRMVRLMNIVLALLWLVILLNMAAPQLNIHASNVFLRLGMPLTITLLLGVCGYYTWCVYRVGHGR